MGDVLRFRRRVDISSYLGRIDSAPGVTEFGVVEKVVANTIESHGPNVTMGSLCWLQDGERRVPLEVVGFANGRVISMPLAQIDSIRQGDTIEASGRAASIGVTESMCGRIVDALGRPLDGQPLPVKLDFQDLYSEPSNPLQRDPIRQPIQTGVRSIDGLLTCGLGQ